MKKIKNIGFTKSIDKLIVLKTKLEKENYNYIYIPYLYSTQIKE